MWQNFQPELLHYSLQGSDKYLKMFSIEHVSKTRWNFWVLESKSLEGRRKFQYVIFNRLVKAIACVSMDRKVINVLWSFVHKMSEKEKTCFVLGLFFFVVLGFFVFLGLGFFLLLLFVIGFLSICTALSVFTLMYYVTVIEVECHH